MTMQAVSESTRSWRLGFESLEEETVAPTPLEVKGRLPPDLEGTLYRVTPARSDVYGERLRHWFDGDGMVHALRLAGGAASLQNRFVDTRGKREEDAAHRRIHGSFGTRPAGGPLARFRHRGRGKNPANTNVIVHGGKLLALCEGGLPHRLDPVTLATLGEDDLGGLLQADATFTAHPKLDRATGDMWGFGLAFGREPLMHVYRVPASGPAEKVTTLRLPFASFVHDFALTAEHLVVVVSPLALPQLPLGLMLGQTSFADALRWRPELGSRVALVNRRTGEARWTTTDPFMMYHVVNAWDEGAEVVLDVCAYPDGGSMDFFRGLMNGVIRSLQRPALKRLRIGRDGAVKHATPGPGQIDFPRVTGRVQGAEHTRIYGVGWGDGEDFLGRPYAIDLRAGSLVGASMARGEFAGECVPVSKASASSESDVWLLTLVLDAAQHRTELRVYDGADLAAPPVATVPLPHVVPFGFHGNWVRAASN
jgi:all-trans-8'-apo-beta-carotenal 15,15'-oxygenase